MNLPEDRPDDLPDAALDRLVDGDLDVPERRELLLRLEAEPDGWRRCALAFLEDQDWRRALAAPATPVGPEPVVGRPAGRARPSPLRISVAASLVAATFALGFAAGGARRGPSAVEVARPETFKKGEPAPRPGRDPIREVGFIDVVDGSAGESRPERLPIISGPGLDDRWLREQPPSVSQYDRAQWERKGYEVEEHRRLVSVVLDDGRRVSIPVDEVELKYVGQQPF